MEREQYRPRTIYSAAVIVDKISPLQRMLNGLG